MLGLTRLLNPHSRSKDFKRVTPVYYAIGESQYEMMQIRQAGNERRGCDHPARQPYCETARQMSQCLGSILLLMNAVVASPAV